MQQQESWPEQHQEVEQDTLEHAEYTEEPLPKGVNVGPVKVDYGNIWLDVIAGTAVLVLVIIGYYCKKFIDKKFK